MLYPEDRSFLAVVYPTADRLKQLQAYAKEAGRPLLIVNPQVGGWFVGWLGGCFGGRKVFFHCYRLLC